MRVGIFTDTYPPEINGVATATEMLKRTFEEHGHTVYIVTTNPYSNKTEYKDKILRVPGLLLKTLYEYRLAGIVHPKATKIIQSWNLDVIHVHTEGGVGVYGRLLAPRIDVPLISTYHTMYVDYTYYFTKGVLDQSVKSIVKRLSKVLSDTCTEFTTPSEKTKDALRSYGVERYINVIPNGIDLNKFARNEENEKRIAQYKKENGLEDTFVLLSLGRVAEEKSIDVLLKCYAAFLERKPTYKTKLLVVGDGPCKANLEMLAHDLNISEYVDFIGKVPYDDVPFYYQLADLYLSASVTETQGLTFIEAIASETIVLCRFDENLSEVIKEKQTGFYFSDEDTFILKLESILKMSDVEKANIKKTAYEINKKFSLETFYEDMLEVYNRAIRKRW